MGVTIGWNYEHFNMFKCYEMHNNWGLITQILRDNKDKVNKLLLEVKRKSDQALGNKRRKVIIKTGETLTPVGLDLEVGDSFSIISENVLANALEYKGLPAELLEEYNTLNCFQTDEEVDAFEADENAQDEHYKEDERISEKIFDAIGFNNNDYLPIKWMAWGKNFLFNSIIGLYLAKKLMPDGEWEICQTNTHTTIFSVKYKLVFDLLVWGSLKAEASTFNMLFDTEYKPATNDEFIAELKKWLEED